MTVAEAVFLLAQEVVRSSRLAGRAVAVDEKQVLDRSGAFDLGRPGLLSANRSCRLVRSADGWIAVNLAREADVELLPAWIGFECGRDVWQALAGAARRQPAQALVDRAALLGLPAARVGEVADGALVPPLRPMGPKGVAGREVIDLSGLWAGPLCGGILAGAGLPVTKIESAGRPDSTRLSMPELDRRLNGMKQRTVLDFADPAQRAALRARILSAGIVITSARRRAFEQLGLDPAALFAARPGLVWVAISGYGWTGEGASRVAFGDDAAAAGGLVRWTAGGEPRFLGDALADPLTGMGAAAAAFGAIASGGGVLIDAAMAGVAAGAAQA